MTDKPRKTLAQMAAETNGSEPQSIAGKPADVCPYCGCAMFAGGTRTLKTRIERYVYCRNKKCGKRFFSHQPPSVIVREVGADDEGEEISSSGRSRLTVLNKSA